MLKKLNVFILFALASLVMACGDDTTEADRVGVASECSRTSDCPIALVGAEEVQLSCLDAFKGGYCGIAECRDGRDCPDGSICVAHTDGENYCFRACDHKSECNANRSEAQKANCSANFEWAEPSEDDGRKACIPSSSGS